MPSSSQHVSATSAAKRGVSAGRRAALEQLFARHMSSLSATAVVRNAVSKAERRAGTGEQELRRQLSLSVKMLVPPQARDAVTRAIDELLAQGLDAPAPTPEPASAGASSGASPASGSAPRERAGSRSRGKLASLASLARPSDASQRTTSASSSLPYPHVSADTTIVLIRSEADMNATRGLARELCKLVGLLGYPAQKVVTAVSELARNIARYASSGRVCFRVDTDAHEIVIVAEDHGPGIEDLEEVLSGNYRSRTGLGRGLLGVRRLASRCEIETGKSGTRVEIAFAY